jgi:beta-phosphoglucomutase-like phosphatase (HAD superfamily)
MSAHRHILFDLDGTLIDSAPAILASYRDSFAAAGREPVRPIDASIVGPALTETLQLLTGSTDPALMEELAGHFKASYDSTGYLQTAAYEGVSDMLSQLAASGLHLAIATNKRLHPTQLILQHLGAIGGLHQGASEQGPQYGADAGIKHGKPDQIARHHDSGPRQAQAAGDLEQDVGEAAEDE